LKIGIFYQIDGDTLKCRDSESVAGSGGSGTYEREVSLDVEEGDFIGYYFSGGWTYGSTWGGSGMWRKVADVCNPGDEATFESRSGWIARLDGTGESVAVAQPYSFIM
jgi:hypothetical protein